MCCIDITHEYAISMGAATVEKYINFITNPLKRTAVTECIQYVRARILLQPWFMLTGFVSDIQYHGTYRYRVTGPVADSNVHQQFYQLQIAC